MTDMDQLATKADVEEIVNRVVTEVVGEVAENILNVVAERFDEQEAKMDARFAEVDARFAEVDARFAEIDGHFNRIENILRPTVDKVDDHEVRLQRIEASIA